MRSPRNPVRFSPDDDVITLGRRLNGSAARRIAFGRRQQSEVLTQVVSRECAFPKLAPHLEEAGVVAKLLGRCRQQVESVDVPPAACRTSEPLHGLLDGPELKILFRDLRSLESVGMRRVKTHRALVELRITSCVCHLSHRGSSRKGPIRSFRRSLGLCLELFLVDPR